MKKLAKNIPSPFPPKGTPIFRDTTALPFADGGPLHDRDINGNLLNSTYASPLGNMYREGGPFGEDQGTFDYASSVYASQPGNYFKDGGQFQGKYSLPEDSFKQGGNNLHNSVYASSPQQYPAVYNFGGTLGDNLSTRQQMYMPLDHITRTGGSILSMSNTPEMSGEGKDLVYANGGTLNNSYAGGGQIYTYAGRPGAEYQKGANGWEIRTEHTNGFVPVKDPTGKRTALLNAQAKPTTIKSPYQLQQEAKAQAGQSSYDMMAGNKPQVSDNTKVQITNKPIPTVGTPIKTAEELAHDRFVAWGAEQNKKRDAQNPAIDPRTGNYRSMSAGEADWVWSAPLAGSAALQAAGAIGAMALPGLSAIPGATVGNLVNSGFIANSLYNMPKNAGEWYDVSQGNKDWTEAAKGTAEIAAGLVGSGAGAKAALQEAEKLGLKNVITGKAPIKDLFKRDDLLNIKTAEDLAKFKAAQAEGKLGETTNRFYSSTSNPDVLNYAKGEEEVFVHAVPQTKAAAAGKSLANIKPEGAALIARQRSIPTSSSVEEMIASGKLSGQSEETLQGLREIAANPEGYWNLNSFKNNKELQSLVESPTLVNPAEHFLPRPTAGDFKLMSIGSLATLKPKLIDTQKITNEALIGLQEEGIGTHAVKHEVTANTENEHKLGGNMNFKSKGAYQNWLGYVHATGVAENTPGNQSVSIKGKTHNVQHATGGNMYANGGSFNNAGFMSLPKEVQQKIRSKSFADGGQMEAQLTEFNAGGRHEENPLGGIPQGSAPDGKLNLVEQGETKLNSENYIFSDSLKVDKDTAAEFALPKADTGKTFADLSKKLNRPNSRRENDTIEQVAIKRDLDNLMNAQEAFKQKEVQKKMEEIQALDPNALTQSYQPQGMPAQGAPQEGMPQGAPEGQPSPEEMAMMQQQGQGQPPMDPAMMQQMMSQQQGAPQMPMQYGGPMSYKCGGGMYEYGGDLSRQFYGGGTMPGSNFSDSGNYYGLNDQGLTTNGLNTQQAAGNNGLSGGQYAQMGLSAVNAGANINRINKSDMSQDAKTSAYGDTASQIGDSTVQTIFPALAPAFAAKNAYQGMLTSNVNPETGEKAYKKGFQASSNEAVTPIHTRQFKGITDFAKDKSAANFGKMAWNFMDPGSAQLFDSAKGIWGKDKYAENQTAIDLNQKSQEDAYNQQQLGLQQQQQNAINTAVQAGLAGYQQQDNPNSNFAKYGGHQFPALTPTYKDNAGPMGQGLSNLYAMGGMFDGPGDPPVTASTIPTGMVINPNYAAQLKEYENAIKFGTAGNAANDYKLVDPSNPEYNNWVTSPEGLSLDKLYESTGGSGMHPIYIKPLKYTPAPTSSTRSGAAGFTSANTGEAMPDRGNLDFNNKPLITDRQYHSYLEQSHNSPEAVAAREDAKIKFDTNVQKFKQKEELGLGMAPAATFAMGGNLGMQDNNEFGGDLDSPTEEDMINHLNNLDIDTTRSFDFGGFKINNRDRFNNLTPYQADYDKLNESAQLQNPWEHDAGMQLPIDPIKYSSMTEAEKAKYLSDLQAADESLKDKNLNLNMNQTWAQAAGLALPAAYNIQQGLFGKVGTLNPEDYYQKADFTPYEYNDNPQRRAIENTFAGLRKDLGNMAGGGGGYAAALQAAANSRNASLGELNAQKENTNAANALDAKVRNKAIEAANKGILSNVTDYNIKAKEAKRKTLAEGLKQGADIARSSTEMDAQSTYLKAIAPDFANTIGYNSIVDQLLASRKASKEAKNKNNKTV